MAVKKIEWLDRATAWETKNNGIDQQSTKCKQQFASAKGRNDLLKSIRLYSLHLLTRYKSGYKNQTTHQESSCKEMPL